MAKIQWVIILSLSANTPQTGIYLPLTGSILVIVWKVLTFIRRNKFRDRLNYTNNKKSYTMTNARNQTYWKIMWLKM